MKINRLRNAPILTALAAACCAFCVAEPVGAQTPAAEDAPPASQDEIDLTPKRYKIDRYKSIWAERSPFEIIVEDEDEEVDETPPFEDYSLAGYSRRGSVWRVTVVNIKDPKEKHYLQSGQVSKDGFELLNFKPERNYKNSEVIVRRGGKSGAIGFDEKRKRSTKSAKAGIGIGGKKPAAPKGKNQPNRSGQPKALKGNAKAAAQNTPKNKTDAAAQIRQMLQNRQNKQQGRATGGSDRSSSKRQPRRRVILPPTR